MRHSIRRVTGRVVVTALAVAGLPAAAVAALPAVASSAAGTATATPRVLTCAGKAVVEPSSYVLTCADAYTYFAGIRWTTWGTTSAKASATYVQNTCTPTCVAGHFVRYPATLTLSAPKKTKYGDLFSAVHYSYTVPGSMTLPLRPL